MMPSIIQSRMMTSGGSSLGQQQRLLAVAGSADVKVLALEMPDEQLGERPVVLDQQQLLAGHVVFRRRFLVRLGHMLAGRGK